MSVKDPLSNGKALVASELSYRRLFEAAKDGILILEADTGRISDVNPFLLNLLGFSHSEMLGRTVGELSPFKDIESNQLMLERLQKNGYVRYEHLPLETRHGSRVDVEFVSNVYQAGDKSVIQCNIRDITKHKQTERILQTTLNDLRDLKTALDEHAIVAVTDPKGKITYVNDKFCSISKYSREELIGQDHRIINSGYHPKEFMRDLWSAITQGRVWHGEIRNQAKDGSYYWVDTTIMPFLDERGLPRQYVSIRSEITEIKTAEEKILRLNAELEQRVAERTAELHAANQESQAFNDSVSHDLRAPLRHVLGFVELLQKDAAPSLSGESLLHLKTIAQAASRMNTMIDDLLSLSRVGKTELQKREIDLNRLMDETIGDFQRDTIERKIDWKVHPLPVVWADRSLLRLVLANLLANAVKFTGKCAQPKIEIGCASNGEDPTVIYVRDNGAGFDPRYTDKLFGVFQRLHSPDEFEGTGIGLANVQRIVQRHGGRAWAEGTVGEGATFYFSIPRTA